MPALTLLDSASGSQARLLPELGFNLFEFSVTMNGQQIDVLDSDPEFDQGTVKPSRCGIPLLFPFPNRIAAGKFSWDGKDYQLPVGKPGDHYIHGFCLDRPWRVIDQSENHVTGEFQLSVDAPDRINLWPADFRIRCTYLVRGNALKARYEFHNPDDKPLPWGFGTHAYFKLPLTDSSSTEHITLDAPVHEQWVLENFIPTGEKIPASADLKSAAYYTTLKLDDVFTDVRPDGDSLDCTIVDEGSGLQVVQACDPEFRELVVFTPPGRDAVCMEPYTCPTDAINLEARGIKCGWQTLAPGETKETWIDIRVEPVMA
ncbi:aldose 1-epimerase [Rubinisphaera brasiliensis]|uniref:Aldose 1-epimerase n=1 Tax=Rubinisphaera brasiliensis (strain ATCC 49424 / DSM 5305 / JCM 21570 / IAM 15109 / NBRC 103401 / IFAM 1448) TaxID=756272 RepID=F0SMR8_RUBBR|nr:aldose 1-epimerase [Rubinisphaera brasiliensis]ADY58887.1 Aldose 1-epimerase [Rubinisphaera brasiliensis DSM 5305]